jgi:hypothetical protein
MPMTGRLATVALEDFTIPSGIRNVTSVTYRINAHWGKIKYIRYSTGVGVHESATELNGAVGLMNLENKILLQAGSPDLGDGAGLDANWVRFQDRWQRAVMAVPVDSSNGGVISASFTHDSHDPQLKKRPGICCSKPFVAAFNYEIHKHHQLSCHIDRRQKHFWPNHP